MSRFAALVSITGLCAPAALAQTYYPPLTGNEWATVEPASMGWCTGYLQPLHDFLASSNSKAFIVLKDGRIAIEWYFGTFTQDSLWYWASAGKSLTAFLVGKAQEEGLLSIDEPSSNYLGTGWTSCTPAQEQAITIRHQLTMTTGLDDGVPDPFCTAPSCLQYLAPPGTRWAYHNGPYTLLDGVLTAATGGTLN
ncbi:MAG: serine hydrolase domain-containing protein, partial [Flavobacteriales bacterium]